jgi:hypothetical protein
MLFSAYIGTKVPLMRTWLAGKSMLPPMVPPTIGPFTTPSRIVSWPFCQVNSARNAEKATPFCTPVDPPAAMRSSEASPLTEKLRMLISPSLVFGSAVGGSIVN